MASTSSPDAVFSRVIDVIDKHAPTTLDANAVLHEFSRIAKIVRVIPWTAKNGERKHCYVEFATAADCSRAQANQHHSLHQTGISSDPAHRARYTLLSRTPARPGGAGGKVSTKATPIAPRYEPYARPAPRLEYEDAGQRARTTSAGQASTSRAVPLLPSSSRAAKMESLDTAAFIKSLQPVDTPHVPNTSTSRRQAPSGPSFDPSRSASSSRRTANRQHYYGFGTGSPSVVDSLTGLPVDPRVATPRSYSPPRAHRWAEPPQAPRSTKPPKAPRKDSFVDTWDYRRPWMNGPSALTATSTSPGAPSMPTRPLPLTPESQSSPFPPADSRLPALHQPPNSPQVEPKVPSPRPTPTRDAGRKDQMVHITLHGERLAFPPTSATAQGVISALTNARTSGEDWNKVALELANQRQEEIAQVVRAAGRKAGGDAEGVPSSQDVDGLMQALNAIRGRYPTAVNAAIVPTSAAFPSAAAAASSSNTIAALQPSPHLSQDLFNDTRFNIKSHITSGRFLLPSASSAPNSSSPPPPFTLTPTLAYFADVFTSLQQKLFDVKASRTSLLLSLESTQSALAKSQAETRDERVRGQSQERAMKLLEGRVKGLERESALATKEREAGKVREEMQDGDREVEGCVGASS